MPDEAAHGPVRTKAIKAMSAIFVVLLVLMLALGTVLVLAQLAGLVVLSGNFIGGVWDALSPWVFGTAGVLGIWTLLLAYVSGYKPAD